MYNKEKFKNIEFLEVDKMATIGERIYNLRKANHLTQTEFGRIFGIGKTTVSSYENGNSCPNDDIKIAICKYFDVPMDYLVGLVDAAHSTSVSFTGFLFDFEDSEEFKSFASWLKKDDYEKISLSTNISVERLSKMADLEIVPTPSELSLISKYFDCTVDVLLGKCTPSPEVTEDDVKVALFKGDGEVTDEMWKEVMDFVDYVKMKHSKEKKGE